MIEMVCLKFEGKIINKEKERLNESLKLINKVSGDVRV